MDMLSVDQGEASTLLAESVAAFAARNPGPARVRRVRETVPGFDPSVWREAAEAGWLGLRLPESVGGSGLGLAELAALMEGLGRNLAPEPVAACAVLAGGVLLRCPAGALRDRLLQGLAAGTLRPAFARIDAPGSPVRRKAGRLSGGKIAAHGAAGADGFIVATADGLCWVEAGAATVTLEPTVDGGFLGTVALRDAPAEPLAEGNVAALIEEAEDEARLAAAAELIGVMDFALATTSEYVRTRRQFGVPIGSFQVLQHRMVDLWIQHRLAKASLNRAIATFDGPARERGIATCAAKARASDAGLLVGRQSIQLHGGMGYTDECDIGLCLKRAVVLAAFLGNGTAQRRRYADLAFAA